MMEVKRGKDKARVVLAAVVATLVILTSVLLVGTMAAKGVDWGIFLPLSVGVMVMLFMIPFIKRRYFDVKAGFPYEDERSKKILLKATSLAYTFSIWWMVALMWYCGFAEENGWRQLIPRHVAAAGIMGMAVLFVVCYMYVNYRGDAE